ncbi:hypothetical protein [Proteiniborus sp.]
MEIKINSKRERQSTDGILADEKTQENTIKQILVYLNTYNLGRELHTA